MTSPRVTVAVPTRNRAPLLREALRSVLSQELDDIEVVVSDNASTDDTADVVASFADPRVTYTRLAENIGLHGNLSRCLTLGSAPYVTIVQDDDYLLPGSLEKKVSVLDSSPDVAVAHSRFSYVGPHGELLRADVDWTGPSVDPIESGDVFLRRSMDVNCRVNLTSALMRRSAVARERFDEADGAQADVGLWLRVALRGSFAFVPETLSVRRVHTGAHSVSSGVLSSSAASTRVTPEHVANIRRVKERFLETHAEQLGPQLPTLRAAAARAPRNQFTWIMLAGLQAASSRAEVLGEMANAVRRAPGVLLQWRFYAGLPLLVAGPRRGSQLLRHRLPRT